MDVPLRPNSEKGYMACFGERVSLLCWKLIELLSLPGLLHPEPVSFPPQDRVLSDSDPIPAQDTIQVHLPNGISIYSLDLLPGMYVCSFKRLLTAPRTATTFPLFKSLSFQEAEFNLFDMIGPFGRMPLTMAIRFLHFSFPRLQERRRPSSFLLRLSSVRKFRAEFLLP